MSEIGARLNHPLSQIDEGSVEEKWQDAVGQVLENIADVNTPADKARTITITCKVEPTKSRTGAHLQFKVDTKLAPPNPTETWMKIEHDEHGVLVGREPEQMNIHQATIEDAN